MMVEPLHTRKRGDSLAAWLIALLVAAVVFWGVWYFLNSQGQVSKHPKVGQITHSTPVGGSTLDGVYHPLPSSGEPLSTRWRI